MVLKFAVSKQEKVKDYTWVETLVNSALGHRNIESKRELIEYYRNLK